AYTMAVAKYETNTYSLFAQDSTLRIELDEKMLHEKDYFFDVTANLSSIADSLGLPMAVFTKTIREGEAEYKIKGVFYKSILYKRGKSEHIIIASAENYQEDRL